MSCTAIEQSMSGYHSPAILRKVEVANWRNRVFKNFFQNLIFMKKTDFLIFKILFIASRMLISVMASNRFKKAMFKFWIWFPE